MMYYNKLDAKMTQGLAITSMVVLHLFCRTGDDVFGSPLIWINENEPLSYLFGFMAEFCVPLYTLIVGYAQALLFEKGNNRLSDRVKRIFKLLKNYWIVLVVFSLFGLLFFGGENIPNSIGDFLLNVVLVKSYNGAWWYVNTYIIILLLSGLIYIPIRKIKPSIGIVLCFVLQIGWYIAGKLLPPLAGQYGVISLLTREATNLMNVLPYVWMGEFLYKGRIFDKIGSKINSNSFLKKHLNVLIILSWIIVFFGFNTIHKSVLVSFVALWIFLTFNLLHKRKPVKKVFLFLGEHSTNVWLVHMFFYASLFGVWIHYVDNPIVIFIGVLGFSTAASYLIKGVSKMLDCITYLLEV